MRRFHRRSLAPTVRVRSAVRAAIAAGAVAVLGLAAGLGAPAQAAARQGAVNDLTFVTPRLGWVVVAPRIGRPGTLYRTENGGQSWRLVARGIAATSLVFRSRSDGEALVPVAGSAGMCHVGLTAVSSTDGGVTWHAPQAIRAEDAPVALAFEGAVPTLLNASCAGAYGAVQAPTAGTQWGLQGNLALSASLRRTYAGATVVSLTSRGTFAVVGYANLGAGAPLLRGYAHRGGRGLGPAAWRAEAIGAAGLPGRLVAVSFANVRQGIVATENAPGTALTVWSTANAGRTWSHAFTVEHAAQATLDMVGGGVAYASLTSDRGDGASTLFKSVDGGVRWSRVVLPA